MEFLISTPIDAYISGVMLLFFLIGCIHDGKINFIDRVILLASIYGFYILFKEVIDGFYKGFGSILPLVLIFIVTFFIRSILKGGRTVAVLSASILLGWVSFELIPDALKFLPGGTDKLATITVVSGYLLFFMIICRDKPVSRENSEPEEQVADE